jgi:hypothetical protein
MSVRKGITLRRRGRAVLVLTAILAARKTYTEAVDDIYQLSKRLSGAYMRARHSLRFLTTCPCLQRSMA